MVLTSQQEYCRSHSEIHCFFGFVLGLAVGFSLNLNKNGIDEDGSVVCSAHHRSLTAQSLTSYNC